MATIADQTIETAIACEDWIRARRLIRDALKKPPASHWLVTRLGLTYYEQRRYRTALSYVQRALHLAPRCHLVLWDMAGALQALQRHDEAVAIYTRLIRRGTQRIAHGPCEEGVAKARGLIADCYYRLAHSYDSLGDSKEAMRAFTKHLDLRGPGCRSIYPLAQLVRSGMPARIARSNKALAADNRANGTLHRRSAPPRRNGGRR